MESQQSEALAVTEPNALARAEELSVEEIVARVQKVHDVQAKVMKEGQHFGKIPGVDKPTLLKPGAELLGLVFKLDPQFETVQELREGNHITYVIRCVLYHQVTRTRLGSGLGSCSTKESKYAYRKAERKCPSCGKPAIIKGQEQYGGGWVCWKKKDGCGSKFADDDKRITEQPADRVENPDVADQHNTVLKMAVKRAHVAATLFVTCASEIFTQDMEDQQRDEAAPKARPRVVSKSPDVMALLDEYAKCSEGGAYQKLEERRKALWGRASREDKHHLKNAQEAAQERVLAAMDAPRSEAADDVVDGEFDEAPPASSREVA